MNKLVSATSVTRKMLIAIRISSSVKPCRSCTRAAEPSWCKRIERTPSRAPLRREGTDLSMASWAQMVAHTRAVHRRRPCRPPPSSSSPVPRRRLLRRPRRRFFVAFTLFAVLFAFLSFVLAILFLFVLGPLVFL
ncbi:MAG: hypothetical protein U5J97_06315 [Trueperaceae bacterium]|nr:hypothetical protein [Trueperaceae bacterium]